MLLHRVDANKVRYTPSALHSPDETFVSRMPPGEVNNLFAVSGSLYSIF